MRVVLGFFALLILLVVAAGVWIYSGTVNVGASAPHAPAVGWVIETIMRQSVRAHARDLAVPQLGDPVLVEEGAKLFQRHCVMCHGGPGVEPEAFSRFMRPQPPKLSDAVGEWTSAELFWIIKHGLKMTGMPAWGRTHVDGEIWSIVAALNQFPTMDPERYRAMVEPPPQAEPQPEPDQMVPPDEEAPPGGTGG